MARLWGPRQPQQPLWQPHRHLPPAWPHLACQPCTLRAARGASLGAGRPPSQPQGSTWSRQLGSRAPRLTVPAAGSPRALATREAALTVLMVRAASQPALATALACCVVGCCWGLTLPSGLGGTFESHGSLALHVVQPDDMDGMVPSQVRLLTSQPSLHSFSRLLPEHHRAPCFLACRGACERGFHYPRPSWACWACRGGRAWRSRPQQCVD